jgi:IclR family KDG regulon transcriptional repressor
MRILRLFSAAETELGVTEIAFRIGISKSSAHRLISTLLKKGYLEKNDANRKYRLGLSVLALSGVITAEMELQRSSLTILHNVVDELGESAHIGILEGNDVVYVHKVECRHPVRLLSDIGNRVPAYCSSAGKVILAYQSQELVETVLHAGLYPYGPNTITDPEKLRDNLKEIRRTGYSVAVDELHEGAVSIAVPVRDHTGAVIAAIGIAGPKQRMTADKFPACIRHLRLQGQKLSEQLGYFAQGRRS